LFSSPGVHIAAAVQPDSREATRRKERAGFNLDRAFEGPPEIDASDEDKANYVLARYLVQNDHYLGLYQQWAKPVFFLVGKQWLYWDIKTGNFRLDTDVPEWRQQPVTNYTYAVYRAAIAKLTKAKPALECVPPSGDSEDRDSAQLSEALLTFLWRYLKKPSKVVRALGWLLSTGKVFFESSWDDEAGELRPRTILVEVPDPERPGETTDVECACDEMGEPARRKPAFDGEAALDGGDPYDLEAEPVMEPIGEITFDVVSPMRVRHNPECEWPDEADEWFDAQLWTAREAATEFAVDINDITRVSDGDDSDGRNDIERLLSSIVAGPPDPFHQPQQRAGSSQDEGIGERVLVIKYYAKPCAKDGYPEGRHWITCGGKKVWPREGDPEYPTGEATLPYGFWPPQVPVIDTPIPGHAEGVSLLSQVVPLNEQLNYLDGKIGEYHTMQAMGGVTWVHPSDRDVVITTEPGQVRVSKGMVEGKPPVREKLEALPAPVYNERAVFETKLRTIAGMSQVDMSQKPEGVTAGRAFLVLQEASDAPFMPLLQAIEEALCETGRRELVIARAKYTEPRVLKIAGQKGQFEFRSFTNADLRDGIDVRVQVGSMYPWSKSAQWDTKLSLIQALPQLVINPATGEVDEAKLARYLDSGVPGLKAFESEENPDLVEIDREHAMFEAYDPTSPEASNQLPQLAFWQNHALHQEHHYNFMKRNYARFLRWSPAAQEAFMEHMRLTTEAVDALAAAMVPEPMPGEEEDGAATGAGDGKKMSIVPGGGTEGRLRTPTAQRKQQPLRLTQADRRAAGQ